MNIKLTPVQFITLFGDHELVKKFTKPAIVDILRQFTDYQGLHDPSETWESWFKAASEYTPEDFSDDDFDDDGLTVKLDNGNWLSIG